MKILYDHQTFTNQTYGGISRYYYELISRFNNKDESSCDVSLLLTNNAYLNGNNYKGLYPFFKNRNFRGKWEIMNSVNQSQSVKRIRKQEFDILHPTYYDTYFLNYLKEKPFVVTFLDMIQEKFATKYEIYIQDEETRKKKKLLLQKASKIISISESTKKDIINIYDVDGDKIEVIYLGSSLNCQKKTDSLYPDSRYILFVGNRSLYKNFNFYLESIAELLKDLQITFVCAGANEFTDSELILIKKLGVSKLVKHYKINDNILSSLYKNALAFVFPSLYEGFGIPVLEAFSCECPCLLSTEGSLPEVGGEAALYFNPHDAKQICDTLSVLINNQQLREELIKKGKERLKLFSWDKTYEQTINLYESIK
ncbi:MAG: glycosyltransferase family 1 protein [Bacteroidetes bacterium]|nr:glycosyltransferase family 1 protein [Bacteroidota bacterium]